MRAGIGLPVRNPFVLRNGSGRRVHADAADLITSTFRPVMARDRRLLIL